MCHAACGLSLALSLPLNQNGKNPISATAAAASTTPIGAGPPFSF
jgi:hypothetical protein